jgi:hypothetical protein
MTPVWALMAAGGYMGHVARQAQALAQMIY